ncbi:uncharacterized protein M6B38_376690 [Iris pallida]|uniref:Uncharacterized protein n=1 Tax=Iris pallida TaxID=29817 RepID=A0AAX6GAX3_IRIPA|nr:uncharacterized protein M6B38_376690 [Iris pallida]
MSKDFHRRTKATDEEKGERLLRAKNVLSMCASVTKMIRLAFLAFWWRETKIKLRSLKLILLYHHLKQSENSSYHTNCSKKCRRGRSLRHSRAVPLVGSQPSAAARNRLCGTHIAKFVLVGR